MGELTTDWRKAVQYRGWQSGRQLFNPLAVQNAF